MSVLGLPARHNERSDWPDGAFDPAEFEEFFRDNYRVVMRLAQSVVGNVQAAQDVAQDVFLAAYRRFPGDYEQAAGWVSSVVTVSTARPRDCPEVVALWSDRGAQPTRPASRRSRGRAVDVRIIGTVWTREPADDPAAVVATLQDWNARIRSDHVQINVLKKWADGTSLSGGALLLQPFEGCKTGDEYGHMTFSQNHIEQQIELAQQAGFDMHIHIDADGSARVVLDAIEAVQRRIGRGTSRHTVCHNTFVHPDDVKRFAQLGVIANCTPLWGTHYDGNFYDMYTEKLGAARMEERLYPYGDLVRSGAAVTYGADIPGVQIREIPPLIQIESLLTRKRPGFPDDRALVPRQRIGLHDALRGYTSMAPMPCAWRTRSARYRRANTPTSPCSARTCSPSNLRTFTTWRSE